MPGRTAPVSVGLVATILLSVLAASAPPVSAANANLQANGAGLVVGSTHTTDSDFQAGTLTNMIVVGSGDDATVKAESGSSTIVYDDFDDGDISEYSGGTGSATVQSATAASGSALELTTTSDTSDNPDIFSTSGLQNYPQRGEEFSFRVNLDTEGIKGRYYFALQGGESFGDGRYTIEFDDKNNFVALRVGDSSGGAITLDTVSLNIPNNQFLYVNVDYGATVSDEITVTLYDDNPENGGSQIAELFVDESADSVASSWDSGGIGWTTFGGTAGNIYYDELVAAGSSGSSGYYLSANHSVSNAAEAAINVTAVENVSASVSVEYYDGKSWVEANSTSVSSPGNITLQLPDVASSTWRVNASYTRTASPMKFTVADDSILFNNHAPTVDNSTATPTGNLTTESTTFEIDVTDTEFGTAQGEQLQAALYVDGTHVGSDTLTSNGTATVTHSPSTGGQHSYHWEVTDSYGATTTSDTFTIQTPSTLRIYNSSSLQLVDNATIEIRMYQNGTIYTRTASDGTANFTGISPTEPFVVVAEAPGYYDRRIFVQSLYDRQSLYLLPTTQQSVDVIFDLQEYTGNYPRESTVLQVERAINGSWEVVLGDYFGANGQFPATLKYNTRYRLRLINIETGQSRLLGTFTPIASGSQTVIVSPTGIVDVRSFSATWSLLGTASMPATSVPFNASLEVGEASVSSWSLTVEYVSNSSTQTLYVTNSSAAPDRSVDTTLNLDGKAGGVVRVTAVYELSDGHTETIVREYDVTEHLANDDSLLALLGQFVDLAPESNQPQLTTFLAMLLTVLVTTGVVATVPISTESVGVVAWLCITGFAIIGWVGYDMVFVAGVGAGSFLAIRRT